MRLGVNVRKTKLFIFLINVKRSRLVLKNAQFLDIWFQISVCEWAKLNLSEDRTYDFDIPLYILLFLFSEQVVSKICSECGKVCEDTLRLNFHIRVKHSGETPSFSCPHCPKTFFQNNNLKRHINEKHGGNFKGTHPQ